MASIGSSILPASALLTSPIVLNFTLALANTEYTITIPINAHHFSIQARGQTTLQIAETVGNSNVTYFTLHPFNSYSVDSLTGSSTINLYVRSSKAAQVLELIYWI